jgi:hypothetical protein
MGADGGDEAGGLGAEDVGGAFEFGFCGRWVGRPWGLA